MSLVLWHLLTLLVLALVVFAFSRAAKRPAIAHAL